MPWGDKGVWLSHVGASEGRLTSSWMLEVLQHSGEGREKEVESLIQRTRVHMVH